MNSSNPKLRIACEHYVWRMYSRKGVWQADARANSADIGTHSLGTTDRDETLKVLQVLDITMAERHGKIAAQPRPVAAAEALPFADGRRLYENHLGRPAVAGGVRPSTFKRYRTVFDKFLIFASKSGIGDWNSVTRYTLDAYAAQLGRTGYAPKEPVLAHQMAHLRVPRKCAKHKSFSALH